MTALGAVRRVLVTVLVLMLARAVSFPVFSVVAGVMVAWGIGTLAGAIVRRRERRLRGWECPCLSGEPEKCTRHGGRLVRLCGDPTCYDPHHLRWMRP